MKHITRPLLYRPFPTATLPPPIEDYVCAVAEAQGCDPAYVALPMLSALASAAGATHRLRVKQKWLEPLIVWTCLVGMSGSGKTPALSAALGFVDRQQADLHHTYTLELAAHEQALAAWEAAGKPAESKPVEPTLLRLLTTDTTTEAVAVLLQRNPRGLLLRLDEMSGWVSGFDRYAAGKGADEARWLEAFGGGKWMIDRKGGGHLFVPYAAVSLAGGTQPSVLRDLILTRARFESGFAARLLCAMPPDRVMTYTEADIPPALEARMGDTFTRLWALNFTTGAAGELLPQLVGMEAEAREAFVEALNKISKGMADLPEHHRAAASKMKTYVARLALLVHASRWGGGDRGIVLPTASVDVASMVAAIDMVGWFQHEQQRVYREVIQTPDEREAAALLEQVERYGQTTERKLRQNLQRYKYRPDDLGKHLGMLLAGRYITRRDTEVADYGGRPTSIYTFQSWKPANETPADSGNVAVALATNEPEGGWDDYTPTPDPFENGGAK